MVRLRRRRRVPALRSRETPRHPPTPRPPITVPAPTPIRSSPPTSRRRRLALPLPPPALAHQVQCPNALRVPHQIPHMCARLRREHVYFTVCERGDDPFGVD